MSGHYAKTVKFDQPDISLRTSLKWSGIQHNWFEIVCTCCAAVIL